MGMRSFAAVAALVVVLVVEGHGQSAFEVASIKRNTSGEAGAGLDISRGQLRATNAPLMPVIRQAFEVMDSQIVGAPDWVATERYDILAKAPEGVTTADAMRPLIRALLAERFKLTSHRETRDMPVFALVRARNDGRFGPGLRQSTVDSAGANQPVGAPPPGTSPEDWPASVVRFTPGRLYLGGYRMAEVLRMLMPLVGRTILDESGITEPVFIRLEYRPQGRGTPPPDAPSDERPDLFTALQEQTGLKLDARRAPIDVLVIDTIERPTPD
jgi:uncharacterized protein (TIGR03435 family)